MQGIIITHRPKKGELASDLQMTTMPRPNPKKNEVLVKVLFSTIAIDDINIAEGSAFGSMPVGPKPTYDKPVTPGIELSGVIE